MFCFLTASRAEVDQQQLLSGAKFVRHSADDLLPGRHHWNPDSSVGVVTAVDLQEDFRQVER